MKTTLEIPDPVFRRAKSVAAARGIPLREFVTEAVKDKLAAEVRPGEKPWVKHMGKLKRLHKETLRINRLIEEDSEKIDQGPGRPLYNETWR
jgi:hypothetical protein